MNYKVIPNKIKILSDNNELKYISTTKLKNGDLVFKYEFVKSIEKMGKMVDFSEGELRKQMNNFFIEV